MLPLYWALIVSAVVNFKYSLQSCYNTRARHSTSPQNACGKGLFSGFVGISKSLIQRCGGAVKLNEADPDGSAFVLGVRRTDNRGFNKIMATISTKSILGAVVAALSLTAVAAPASAGDLFGRREKAGSIKDAPAEEPKRLCSFSMNIGGTTDYVFRGISQSYEDPAAQGGVDATCGMFYAGVWGSKVDFVRPNSPYDDGDANLEVDLYAGIKPTWGPLTFDLGVIYYWYPGADDLPGAELDYVELKLGASGTWNNFTLGGTVFWSPNYFAGSGSVVTLEGSAGYAFPAIGPVTPSVTGLIGTSLGDDQDFETAFGGDYVYWNAGLSLAIDKLTLDFRYWGSNNDLPFFVTEDLVGDRFVFTAKVTLP